MCMLARVLKGSSAYARARAQHALSRAKRRACVAVARSLRSSCTFKERLGTMQTRVQALPFQQWHMRARMLAFKRKLRLHAGNSSACDDDRAQSKVWSVWGAERRWRARRRPLGDGE
eukprot:1396401-Pleurochrysis_carterae.AAC.1